MVPVVTFDGTNVKTYNFYATYQWYINTVTIPGATNYQTLAYTNGSYNVIVTDTNGCQLLSAATALFHVGVNDVNALHTISIYPNPATDVIHIECGIDVNVTISTIEGKSVMQAGNQKDINISS